MTDNLATTWGPHCRTTSATPSPREDVFDTEIERQIERAENHISRLYRKRNEIRSPIYSLPPEILTIIFKFVCPPVDFPREHGLDRLNPDDVASVASPHILTDLTVLAAVSARWHSLVVSTPSLWTSFVADNYNIKRAKTIFSRAGSHLVSVSFDFWIEQGSHAILGQILQEHASQVHMLYVHQAPADWLKEYIPGLVKLEFLCLEGYERGGSPILIESSCTHLVLKDCSCRFTLSWSKIEVLHLEDTPVDVCLELLQKCTCLLEYRARRICPPDEEDIQPQLPSSPFVLPRLKLFEWAMVLSADEDIAMLQYIRLPVLQTLVWVNERFDGLDVTTLPHVFTFFEHLPLTLSAVEIRKGECPSGRSSVFSYFSNLSNIESLTLRECSSAFVNEVFSTLGSEICLEEMPVFPKLKSIYIDVLKDDLDQAKILNTFRRSCSQPSELLLGDPFRIETTRDGVNWMPELKEELVMMVEKGHRVELWEDSKPVNWLPR
ncbi:hypothetical protein AGABI1DRAFT_109149 [Agaricus bisporus var. burnettii JB137-S8]|uniref:Uncharacterized protein n=1 Tax=Agaricus bisporus var. burnettii (strain JB137-S8 / ATCC MYA-4627 / FGSC 10392) TaxID=597362 RepID=K5WYK1_AGABU|nr:uncharacterized protein AGABI1DRAFT_109149 [Agaricus bisporus var. burnettii JB137-S8]EKM75913.1 hypothetical protein AGABI1DRAFT_109149 [Agaricus bisporus var. burnettii JB137-S8]